MSSSLCWQPIKESWRDLPTGLKFAMQKKYDGLVNAILDRSDVSYLEGLRDADIKGAQALIDAIEKYGQIEVKEIF